MATGSNSGENVEGYDLQSTRQDVRFVGRTRQYIADEETSAGRAGTADDSSNRHFINFRWEYVRGPVVDHDTAIHDHFFLNSHHLSENLRIGANLSYPLVKDVLDE